jgi:hypothetical protein
MNNRNVIQIKMRKNGAEEDVAAHGIKLPTSRVFSPEAGSYFCELFFNNCYDGYI